MRNLIILWSVIIFSSGYSQEQLLSVSGTAIDSTNGLNKVTVGIFENFDAYFEKELENDFFKLSDFKHYTTTDANGYFKIDATPNNCIVFQSKGHWEKVSSIKHLLSQNEINIRLKPKRCIEATTCLEDASALYVFVGKKIEANTVYKNYCDLPLDTEYKSKYEVLENIYGNYPHKSIEFTSFEHNAIRNYYDYDTVILYVGRFCDDLIHIKYLYDPVCKTTDGKWASKYDIQSRFLRSKKDTIEIKPERISFIKSENIRLKRKTDIEKLKEMYPEPYYKINGKIVTPVYGYYSKAIFDIRKKYALKWYFKNHQETTIKKL